jgi:hypothetical protein
MTTRSGTKEYHGSAYYFLRNEAFNANDFFRNKSADPRLNSGPALYRFNVMGVTLGGPVFSIPKVNPTRDKLFFFYSFDNTLNRVPDATFGRYNQPTALERAGDFSQSLTKPKDPTTGQAFVNNQIPLPRINSTGQALLNIYPQPNVPNNGSWNYETLRVQKIPNYQHVFRIDHKLSSNDTLYVRGALWRKDTNGAGGTVGYGTTPLWPFLDSHYQYSDDSLVVNYTHIWSAKVISEFTAGARHSTEKETKDDFDAVAKKGSRKGLGLNLGYIFPGPSDNIFDLIPNITYTGVTNPTTVGFGTRFGLAGYDTGFNVTHATTFSLNKHTVKLGIYWNRALNMEARSGAVNGTFDFGVNATNPLDSGNAFANQLLGNFRSYTETNTRLPYMFFRHIIDWYAQDTWRVTRKLTLDYGVRFSHAPFFYQKNGKSSVFDVDAYKPANAPRQYVPGLSNGVRVGVDPGTGQTVPAALISAFVPGTGSITNGIIVQGDPGVPRAFIDSPGILVMPRFGFAYDPFGDGKTAIRGGAGVFYQTEDDGFFGAAAQTANPPFILTGQVFNSNLSQLTPGSGFIFPPSAPFVGVGAYDRRNNSRPKTYNFSLGVQRNLGAATIVDVKYVGSLSRNLGGRRDINTLPFGKRFEPASIDKTTPNGAPLLDNLLRRYPGYGSITALERNLSSNYHSMQATLNRRFSKGFQFGIAYTYSKALDYGSDERSFGAAMTPLFLDVRRNYGKSSFDQTHIFVANWQYDIPGAGSGALRPITRGWQLSGVAAFSSGTPQAITPIIIGGTDLMGGGDPQRVNLKCNPNLGHYEKTDARFFNTSCISLAGKGDIGNAPKDVFRGPGRTNIDTTLFRNFNFGERRVLTFRWEVYNIFNHTQFSTIDSVALNLGGNNISTTFGSATGAYSARQMQFSLRFTF